MINVVMGKPYKVTKNGHKVWTVDVRFTDENGKRKVTSSFAGTKNEAMAKALKKYEAMICHSEDLDTKDVSFESYATDWLYNEYIHKVEGNTWERVEQALRIHVIPWLGHKKMKEIRGKDVFSLLVHRKEMGDSHSTLKKYRSAVSLVFKAYINESAVYGVINPAANCELPKAKVEEAKPKVIKTLSMEQCDAFFKAATDTYRNGTPVYRYGYAFVLMAYTGLRPSEAIGLCWDCVASDFSEIVVCRRAVEEKNHTILKEGTKTFRSARKIMLSSPAKIALQEMHKLNGSTPYVFATEEGTLCSLHTLRREFQNILDRAGIKDEVQKPFGPHTFRRTFATKMTIIGTSPEVTAALMGHSSVTITLDHYVEPKKERKKAAIDALAEGAEIPRIMGNNQ